MQNPRLAERYAKSLIDISIELNQLDTVHGDVMLLQSICGQSRDFVLMLNSPIITADKINKIKGIHKAKLTTAMPVSDAIKNSFIEKIKADSSIKNIEMETKVDEKLVGGFMLEMDGKLIDASILRDIKDVKKQFANNDYIHKLR